MILKHQSFVISGVGAGDDIKYPTKYGFVLVLLPGLYRYGKELKDENPKTQVRNILLQRGKDLDLSDLINSKQIILELLY